MQARAGVRIVVPVILLLAVAGTAYADVSIELSSAVPDTQGKIEVDVTLQGGGAAIGGFQNDILFDHDVLRLDSSADCRINAAIGTTPLGSGDGETTCADDSTIGACKTLIPSLIVCEGDPPPSGCPAEAPSYSRLRAIVAATEVLNNNAIPDGVAYTCTFTVINSGLLPVRLFNTNVVVADAFGKRLSSRGEDGGACVDEDGSRRCAPLREVDERCTLDIECATGNCDRCCDHQFNGICAAPRTPTTTVVATPTRTTTATRSPTRTRTPSPTYTVTNTPTPKSIGDRCFYDQECASNLSCNPSGGGVCCTSSVCPQGMACNVPGFEGYCVRGETPVPEVDGVVIEVGSATPGADGVAEVTVSLRSYGNSIGAMQNDILFDNTVVSLTQADCTIAMPIGLFPLGEHGPSCFDDASIGPCKSHFMAVEQCGTDPLPARCPQSAGPNLTSVRNIVAATAAPNNNAIPQGTIYTCRFRVLDSTRLPVELHNLNVVVSSAANAGPRSTGISGRIDAPPAPPGSNGTDCSRPDDCDSCNCVDGVWCSQVSCDANESCAVSGSRGDCTPRRLQGEGCDLGTDCETGNCDLHRSSAASIFRGACGAPRGSSIPLPAECSRGDECDSGNCVDQFCCDADECPSGQFCNSGQCASPAEPGARCSADEQCALGLCVDGVCCVTGSCAEGQSCSIVTREGVCHEPFRLGSPCSLDEQCPTGFCTSGVCCLSDSCPRGSVCLPAAGKCVGIGSEPGKPNPPGEDSGVPTAPTPASAPTASVTAARNRFSLTPGDGCSMTPRGSGIGLCWSGALLALLAYARRRTAVGRSR